MVGRAVTMTRTIVPENTPNRKSSADLLLILQASALGATIQFIDNYQGHLLMLVQLLVNLGIAEL